MEKDEQRNEEEPLEPMQAPDVFPDYLVEDGYVDEPVDMLDEKNAVPLYPGPSFEELQKKHTRQYKLLMAMLYTILVLGTLGTWGAALFGVVFQNVWLVWICGPIAAGALMVFGNLAIFYVKRSFMQNRSFPAVGHFTPRTPTPEQQQALIEQEEKEQKARDRAREKRDKRLHPKTGCFGNYCNMLKKLDRGMYKNDCRYCHDSSTCFVVTNGRLQMKFYKHMKGGDTWKPDEEE